MLLGTNPLLLSQKSLLNAFFVSVGFNPLSVNVLREKSFSLEMMGFWCKSIRTKICGRNVSVPVKNLGKISQLKDKNLCLG